jgi:hypothetical protein
MKFLCENFGKKFDQHEECKNHENSCTANKKQYVYLKYIMVYPEIDDYDVYVYEHPKAIKVKENYYILNENSILYNDRMYEPEFDTIRITNDENPKYYIITENLDLIYEDECITKLLNHKLILAKEEYERIGESIKNFSTSNYQVRRKMM